VVYILHKQNREANYLIKPSYSSSMINVYYIVRISYPFAGRSIYRRILVTCDKELAKLTCVSLRDSTFTCPCDHEQIHIIKLRTKLER
jgi:hypothetical protein